VQLFASPSSLFLTTVLNKLYTNREMLWLQNELLCSSKTRSCIMTGEEGVILLAESSSCFFPF
jgi:hypothetical protein